MAVPTFEDPASRTINKYQLSDLVMYNITSTSDLYDVSSIIEEREIPKSTNCLSTDLGLVHGHSGQPMTGPHGNAARHLPSDRLSDYQDFRSISNNMYNCATHFQNVL